MSTLTEKAREEAARAEAEEPETEPSAPTPEEEEEEAQEVETPPAQTPPPTPEDIEKRYKLAAKQSEAWFEKITKTLGPEIMAGFVPSPLDTFPGIVEIGPDGQPEPNVKAETLAFLLYEAPPAYKPNPDTTTCPRCDGWGDVQTGAKRKGNELVKCSACNGFGYTPPPTGAVPPANGTTTPSGAPYVPVAGELPHAPDDPRVAELRAQGYTILEPINLHP
jgi:hypothetical protein